MMASEQAVSVQRALLSVSDKTHIVSLAKALQNHGVELLSTGGTAKLLRENNINVTEVSEFTDFPEIMAGRVKTLHPKIAGGILGRRNEDAEVMAQHDIKPIDLVVVNLYPFQKTIENPEHQLSDAVENIDIGGPNMIRAAAKNYQHVSVLVDPSDYDFFLEEFESTGTIQAATRFKLMQKAFAHTAQYDSAIARYFSQTETTQVFPENLILNFEKKQDLRYGENPHQQAALYVEPAGNHISVAHAKQLQGKALSFNNIVDADTALECVNSFDETACVIVKHANPCGVAIGNTLLEAYEQAFKTDPTSAFGGIIAFNKIVSQKTAEKIISQQFVEVVIAPEFAEQALEVFAKKKNVRLLATGYLSNSKTAWDFKRIPQGLLVQSKDTTLITPEDLQVKTQKQPSDSEFLDLCFAWKVAKFVKSNAIVYARNHATIGVGAGQMSRVYSARIAQIKAKDENLEIQGSVMASDAFFPFRDSIDAAASAGISAIIQPGGSIRDEEVIQAADEHNIAMVFTGIRHFRH